MPAPVPSSPIRPPVHPAASTASKRPTPGSGPPQLATLSTAGRSEEALPRLITGTLDRMAVYYQRALRQYDVGLAGSAQEWPAGLLAEGAGTGRP